MRTKRGTVTSTRATGTVTVTVHRHVFHPTYRKRYRLSKKFLADPGEHQVADGDLVLIGECRPLSKRKRFRVIEVLKKAGQFAEVAEDVQTERAMHRERRVAGSGERVASETADGSAVSGSTGADSGPSASSASSESSVS